MSLYNWLVVVHVLASMTWVGGGLMLSIIGWRARSTTNPNALSEFAQILPFVGLRVLMPAVVIVLVTGVFMVLNSAEWHFSQFWVLLALGLFGLAFLIGGVYLGRVGIAMKGAVAEHGVAPEARALLNRWLAGYGLVLVVLLVAVGDMIFKPGAG